MNILIAIPCFGGQLFANFFTSILALIDVLKENNIKYDIQTIQNESPETVLLVSLWKTLILLIYYF